jgi:[methyl-Co(III) methanol-specific corrinoid protein]:coenzyme M methyltransferase
LRALSRRPVDRQPFIVPGGLISMPLRGMDYSTDASTIAAMSFSLNRYGGVENLGFPYTMRFVSAALGGERDGVTAVRYPLRVAREYGKLRRPVKKDFSLALDVVKRLREKGGLPVIADIAAPLSVASSLISGDALLKSALKEPEELDGFLEFLNEVTVEYARWLLGAGADCIFVVDPFSTASTLAGALFERLSVRYINKMLRSIRPPAIVHVCGPLGGLGAALSRLEADCLSIDCPQQTPWVKSIFPAPVMAQSLEADILSLSCGLDSSVSANALETRKHLLFSSILS